MTPEHAKAARQLLGWSRSDLAGYVGVSERIIGKYENGLTASHLNCGLLRSAFEFRRRRIHRRERRRGGREVAQRGRIGRTAYAETVRSEGVPAWEGSGMTLTPDQVKAGRELAGWSRLKLAARVNVCDQTIRRYERGEAAAATLDLMMVRQILELAGVEFIGGEAEARLRKATAE